ncbi:hypothetical protein BC830DRAFT_271411 [Chytriomyces sp. MP71]|nr:hypothetical protein BC830DRAFT_271411 [Chytriomyces sp. MP71]
MDWLRPSNPASRRASSATNLTGAIVPLPGHPGAAIAPNPSHGSMLSGASHGVGAVTSSANVWPLVRVNTSVASFVVPCAPLFCVKDLVKETNKLLAKHGHAHEVIALRTENDHVLDDELLIAAATDRNQDLIALSEPENKERALKVHPFFGGPPRGPDLPRIEDAPLVVPTLKDPASDLPVIEPVQVRDRSSITLFISYCWANSQKAMGTHSTGACDPRFVRTFLREKGFTDIWIDTERIKSGADLFEQIANGIMESEVMIVFVSDEYAVSKNCVRELNYGINNM